MAYSPWHITSSSPRTRRYFSVSKSFRLSHWLFSAHAEVFPSQATSMKFMFTLLRARGGIS